MNAVSGSTRLSLADYKRLVATGVVGKPKRRASPEEDLHKACIEWVGLQKRRYPLLHWLVHVPNGGKRPKGEAGKLKAMGTKAGFPDLLLPRRNLQWQGLVIELKSDTGRVSKDQAEWLEAFKADGYLVGVARTLEQFQELVLRYLKGRME